MTDPDRVAFGAFVLERSRQRVLGSDGKPLALTPRLVSALMLLTRHPGELLDKDTLIKALWPGLVVEENNLSQVISALRRALGDDAQDSHFIQTVPRRGFRFIADVTPLVDPTPADAVAMSAPGPTIEPEPDSPDPHLPRPARRMWLGASLAGGLAVTLGGVAWQSQRRTEPVQATPPPRVTLAVLPFKPLVADGRDELLEIGMADSLVARLSAVPGLVVRSVGSVGRYVGADQDPMRAAHELDVAWIVDGSLQRRGDRLRTTARLLNVADGSAAWSGTFDATFTDVFDMQDQISARVMEALSPNLQADAAGRTRMPPIISVGGTRNIEAYQLYLTATRLAQGGRDDRIVKAIGLFNQALEIDPTYGQAWVGLSWAHRRRLWNVDAVPTEVFVPANVALQRALIAAPRLAEAHAGLGFGLYWYDFDWAGAESRFRRALDLNPNVALAHYGLALLLMTQDRIDEGFAQMRAARELDPMAPSFHVVEAGFLINHRRFAEARQLIERAFDIAPDLWLSHVAMGNLHLAEGNNDAGIASLRRGVKLARGTTRPQAVLAFHLARTGNADEARAILREFKSLARIRYVPPISLASVHAALGETGQALDALEQAVSLHDVRVIYLKDDPFWAGLRDEPRFLTLMRRLKLNYFGPGLSTI